jgi:hypothetical protein
MQARVALGQRAGARVRRLGDARDTEAVTSRGPGQAHLEGFDLHANVWVSAHDRAGLERLARYILRPPFAQERLRRRGAGRIALELKTAWHDDPTIATRASRRSHLVMDRRAFLSVVGGSIFAAPLVVEAQQSTKARRIGLLIGSSESFVAPFIEIFRQALRALGYVHGGNIAFEYRYADGNYDRLPVLAAELVRLKVDIVVTEGTPPTRAAKHETSTIPIVMTVTGDPVAAGLVSNLARLGGNLTGASFFFPEIAAKRLQLLKEVIRALSCGIGSGGSWGGQRPRAACYVATDGGRDAATTRGARSCWLCSRAAGRRCERCRLCQRRACSEPRRKEGRRLISFTALHQNL